MFDTIDKKIASQPKDDSVSVLKLEPVTVRHADSNVRVTHAKFLYSSPDTIRDDVQRCVYRTFGVSACVDPCSVKVGKTTITADILAPEHLTMPVRNYAYWGGIAEASREKPTVVWAQAGDRVRAFHGVGLVDGEVTAIEGGHATINNGKQFVTIPMTQIARITSAFVHASSADPAFHCMAKYFPKAFTS